MTRWIPELLDVQTHEVDDSGELIIHDPAGRQLLVLNAVGAAIFELLDGDLDLEQIADVLAESVAISRTDALGDVERFVRALEERKILRLHEMP